MQSPCSTQHKIQLGGNQPLILQSVSSTAHVAFWVADSTGQRNTVCPRGVSKLKSTSSLRYWGCRVFRNTAAIPLRQPVPGAWTSCREEPALLLHNSKDAHF